MKTTTDFFAELDREEYLAFLQWPKHIITNEYPLPEEEQHAEHLSLFLLYAWLSHGVHEHHYRPIYLLADLYFKGDIHTAEGDGYALTVLASVLVQALIIASNGLFKPLLGAPTAMEVKAHMTKVFDALPAVFSTALKQQQKNLDDWAKDQFLIKEAVKQRFMAQTLAAQKTLIHYAGEQPLSEMSQSRMHQLHVYLNRLSVWGNAHDFHVSIRTGMLRSLIQLLPETEEAKHPKLLADFVQRIRAQNPEQWEIIHLDQLYQPSALSQLWSQGKSIFSAFQVLIFAAEQKDHPDRLEH